MPLRVLRDLELALSFVLLTALLGGSTLNPSEAISRVQSFTRPFEFDYFNWTLNAFAIKFEQAALGSPYYFRPASRHQIVINYLHLMDEILQLEYQLNLIYTDPAVQDPGASSTSLRGELSALYARQSRAAPFAEAVLQEQLCDMVAHLGLAPGGQTIPPVLFHFSPLPYNLIVSPREEIRQEVVISLIPDLSVDRQARLEEQVDHALNVSSLVVPVGGIGSYPTMVMRSADLTWLVGTIAHEWVHNWLNLRPLGLNYEISSDLHTMNETAASIAGHEISARLLYHYYPELQPGPADEAVAVAFRGNGLPYFDFQTEMHTTRVHVDQLLAQGQIQEAEAYMEQRRLFFWENGYPIRKINQAYFAFHGAYADIPGGASGEDPVGPAVRALRAQSTSLEEFLRRIAAMTSFSQLQAAVLP